jgi:hypothetical protein
MRLAPICCRIRYTALSVLASEPPEVVAELRARIAAAAEMPEDFLPVPADASQLRELQPGDMVDVVFRRMWMATWSRFAIWSLVRRTPI